MKLCSSPGGACIERKEMGSSQYFGGAEAIDCAKETSFMFVSHFDELRLLVKGVGPCTHHVRGVFFTLSFMPHDVIAILRVAFRFLQCAAAGAH